MRVKTVHWGASKYPIRPVLTSISQQKPDWLSCEPSKVWKSLTPYVPPKHFYRGNLHGAKLKQKDSPENQLAAELDLLGITWPVTITRHSLNPTTGSNQSSQTDWDIVRAPADQPPQQGFEGAISTETHAPRGEPERRIGFFFQLTFDQPVVVCRTLGHSCHFGLFTPLLSHFPKKNHPAPLLPGGRSTTMSRNRVWVRADPWFHF